MECWKWRNAFRKTATDWHRGFFSAKIPLEIPKVPIPTLTFGIKVCWSQFHSLALAGDPTISDRDLGLLRDVMNSFEATGPGLRGRRGMARYALKRLIQERRWKVDCDHSARIIVNEATTQEGTGFGLVLRDFGVDLQVLDFDEEHAPDWLRESLRAEMSFVPIDERTYRISQTSGPFGTESVAERVQLAVTEIIPTIGIQDQLGSIAGLGLFVPSILLPHENWRFVIKQLVVAANYLVVVATSPPGPGLTFEVALIERLGRTSDCVVVWADHDSSLSQVPFSNLEFRREGAGSPFRSKAWQSARHVSLLQSNFETALQDAVRAKAAPPSPRP